MKNEIIVNLEGFETAIIDGQRFKHGKNPIGVALRKTDAPDDAIVKVIRGQTVCFKPLKAKVWKALTVSENENHGPKWAKYSPRDFSELT